jgi:hypothetical protein
VLATWFVKKRDCGQSALLAVNTMIDNHLASAILAASPSMPLAERSPTMTKPARHDADILLRLAELSAMSNLPAAATYIWSDDFPTEFASFRAKFPRGKRSDEESLLRRYLVHWETACTLYRNGLFNEDLFFDWEAITPGWDRIKGYVLGLREEFGMPELMENFEYAAERARSWKPKRR